MHTRYTTILLALSLLTLPAAAGDDFIYGQAGNSTTTAGIGYGHFLDDDFAVRIGLGRSTSRSTGHDVDTNHFDIAPKAGAELEAMLDWYPITASGLRLSGGFVYRSRGTQDITAHPNASGFYQLGGHQDATTDVGVLKGQVSTDKLVPQLGIGWESGDPHTAGWHFTGDLNLQLNRPHNTHLTASGTNAATQADVAVEQRRFADDWQKSRFQLGLMLGATYSF
jgi:hypothetical protein